MIKGLEIGKITLDYVGEPDIITRVLKIAGKKVSVSERVGIMEAEVREREREREEGLKTLHWWL